MSLLFMIPKVPLCLQTLETAQPCMCIYGSITTALHLQGRNPYTTPCGYVCAIPEDTLQYANRGSQKWGNAREPTFDQNVTAIPLLAIYGKSAESDHFLRVAQVFESL